MIDKLKESVKENWKRLVILGVLLLLFVGTFTAIFVVKNNQGPTPDLEEDPDKPVISDQTDLPPEDPNHTHDFTIKVVEPTCTDKGYTTHTCNCGYSYIDGYVDALGHDYKTEVKKPTCTEGGFTKHTCTRCGDEYVDEEKSKINHQYEVKVKKPTCTEEGYTTHTCKLCGHSYTDGKTNATGHRYSTSVVRATCTEGGYTTFKCRSCGHSYVGNYVNATGHNWGKWTVVEKATTEKEGLERRTCSKCKEVEERTIPKKICNHNFIVSETVLPTCIKTGHKTMTCTLCGATKTETLDKIPHNFKCVEEVKGNCTVQGYKKYQCQTPGCTEHYTDMGPVPIGHVYQYKTKKAATCTETGIKIETCANCDHYEEITTPALGHDYQYDTTAATCEEDGLKITTCSRCELHEEEVLTKLGHDFQYERKEPTCKEAGYVITTCSRCDYYNEETLEKLEHSLVPDPDNSRAATCTEAGVEAFKCENCDYTETRPIPALKHDLKTETTDATCYKPGKIVEICQRPGCGYRHETEIPQLKHIFHTERTEPDCENPGQEVITCERPNCPYRDVKPIKELGHEFTEFVRVVEPTTTEQGYTIYKCKNCEKTEKRDFTDPVTATVTLENGALFNKEFRVGQTMVPVNSITFLKTKAPAEVVDTAIDVSAADDRSILMWKDEENNYFVASKETATIYANSDCGSMFFRLDGNSIVDPKSIVFENFNTDNVESMSYMFYGNESLQSLDVSGWNTSKVKKADRMFAYCESLTSLDLSGFETDQLVNTNHMFLNCLALQDLDVSTWTTPELTTTVGMFRNCRSLRELNLLNWNTDKIMSFSNGGSDGMFMDCNSLTTIYGHDWMTGRDTMENNYTSVFRGCTSLVGAVPFDPNELNLDMANPYTGYFKGEPREAELMAGFEINPFIPSTVKHVVFTNTTAPEGVEVMDMTKEKNNLYIAWIDGDTMYFSAPSGKKMYGRDFSLMFNNKINLETVDLTNLSFEDATTTESMFSMCNVLNTVTFGKKTIAPVLTNTISMFEDCSSLTSVNMKAFEAAPVYMTKMFRNCGALTELDLRGIKVKNGERFNEMFNKCGSITTIYVLDKDWLASATNAVSDTAMFGSCTSIVGESGKAFDSMNMGLEMANTETGYFSTAVIEPSPDELPIG